MIPPQVWLTRLAAGFLGARIMRSMGCCFARQCQGPGTWFALPMACAEAWLSTRSMSANLPNVHCLRPLQPILPLLFSEPWVSAYGAPGVPDGTRVMRKYMALSDAFAAMVSGDVAPAT